MDSKNLSSRVAETLGFIDTAWSKVKNIGNAAIQTNIDIALQDTHSRLASVAKAALEAAQMLHSLENKVVQLEAEKAELNKRNAALVEWKEDAPNYYLEEVSTGAFVYIYQPPTGDEVLAADPKHWLCTHCYNKGQKSILQYAGFDKADRVYKCHAPECHVEIRVYEALKTVHSRSRRGGSGLFDKHR